MRKIFASILVLAMALASFSMVAFAAPATDIYFGAEGVTAVTATEDTYTVEVYYNPASHAMGYDGVYYIGSLSVKTAVTGATITNMAATITNLDSDVSSTDIMFSAAGDPAELTGAVKMADITVTRADNAETSVLTLSAATASDYDGDYQPTAATLTITWPGSEPEETTTEVAAAKAEYTNVQGGSGDNIFGVWVGTYNVTAGDAAKAVKKVSVAFTGDSHAPFVVDNLNIEGAGTTAFKVAIIGVPETLVNASVATVTIQ